MKKLTKAITVVMSLAMAASLAACGGSSSTAASSSAASTAETTAETSASGEDSTVFRIGTNAEFPPFEFVTTDGVLGEYDGIDMAIAKEIADENGMTVEVNNMEFDSLLVALNNGQIDAAVAGMTITEERQESVDFSEPYYNATQVMIVPEDSDITKASDMEGKEIRVIQGYTGETAVADLGYSYQSFKKGTEAIMELVNGKCDVVVIDSATANKYIADNEGLKIVEDNEAFGAEEYGIAVKKGNTELLDKINAAIEKMKADGTIDALGEQYADAEATSSEAETE